MENTYTPALQIAQNPHSTAEQLRRIWEQRLRIGELNEALARNPNTPPEILVKLFGRYANALSENPVLPLLPLEDPGFIERLEVGAARQGLAGEAFPAVFVTWLQTHPNTYVAEAAQLHVRHAGEIPEAEAEVRLREALVHFPLGDKGYLAAMTATEGYDAPLSAWIAQRGGEEYATMQAEYDHPATPEKQEEWIAHLQASLTDFARVVQEQPKDITSILLRRLPEMEGILLHYASLYLVSQLARQGETEKLRRALNAYRRLRGTVSGFLSQIRADSPAPHDEDAYHTEWRTRLVTSLSPQATLAQRRQLALDGNIYVRAAARYGITGKAEWLLE